MLSLNFYIYNPWYKENFKNIFNKTVKLSEYKVFEFEVTRYSYDLLGIHLSTKWSGGDHEGPRLDLALFGYSVSAKIYDTRHWDYENKCWENYSDTVAKT